MNQQDSTDSRGGPLLDVRIADLASAVLDAPMNEQPEPWTYDLGEYEIEGARVAVAVNNGEPNRIELDGCAPVDNLAPYRMVLWYNGWPAYLGPNGTHHLGGPDAENLWIRALEAAVEAEGGELTPEEEADDE